MKRRICSVHAAADLMEGRLLGPCFIEEVNNNNNNNRQKYNKSRVMAASKYANFWLTTCIGLYVFAVVLMLFVSSVQAINHLDEFKSRCATFFRNMNNHVNEMMYQVAMRAMFTVRAMRAMFTVRGGDLVIVTACYREKSGRLRDL